MKALWETMLLYQHQSLYQPMYVYTHMHIYIYIYIYIYITTVYGCHYLTWLVRDRLNAEGSVKREEWVRGVNGLFQSEFHFLSNFMVPKDLF